MGYVALMGKWEMRRNFGWKEGKRLLRRPRPIWEDNIKTELMEREFGGVVLIDMSDTLSN